MLLFLFCLFTEPQSQAIELDSIYKPLSISTVVIAPNKHLYVLDKVAKKILQFDEHGKAIRSFSGPGEGPGELKLPDNMVIYKDAIYVTDYYKGTQVFNLNGEFQYSRKPKAPFLLLDIVANGWVYQITNNDTKTTEIFWASPDLSQEKSLISYDVPQQEMFIQLTETGSIAIDFRPGQEIPTWHLGNDREHLFVFIPGSRELVVIDLMQKEIIGNLPIPFERQPMNKGWAKLQGEALKDRVTLNGKKVSVDVKTTTVDFFPIISDFFPGADGHLWLLDGPSEMEKTIQAAVMDYAGTELKFDIGPQDMKRIVAIDEHQATFLSFDPTREIAEIRTCRQKDLAQQLKAFPNQGKDSGPNPIDIRTQ